MTVPAEPVVRSCLTSRRRVYLDMLRQAQAAQRYAARQMEAMQECLRQLDEEEARGACETGDLS